MGKTKSTIVNVFFFFYTDVVGTKYSTYLGKNVFPKTAGGSDMRVYLL